ncbi:MAG: toprim domain-containing protein, partial [Pseudomonadota bacterium]|nr:toprim domain-containing protein [Pseudomonadota bacterium]
MGGDVQASTDTEVEMPVHPDQTAAHTSAQERVYLAVPYAQKDEAKGLGARWDRTAKAWYVPPGADLAEFARWMPAAQAQSAAATEDPRLAFGEALRAAGFALKGPPIMDGRIQRVRVLGDSGAERSGAYTGYLDGRPSGWMQNHKTGVKTNWSAAPVPGAAIDRAAMAAEAAEKRKAREAELEQQYLIAGENAERIWAAAEAVERHSYLDRKGVAAHGLRVATPATIAEADRLYPPEGGKPGHAYAAGDLLVPVQGPDGMLWTLQALRADGRKGFGKGGRLSGCSYMIGDVEHDGAMLIAEGFATGATLHEITGQPVAVAFNAGNLAKVAEAYRARFPDRPLVIAGDNDHQAARQLGPDGRPRKNVGATKAEEAAAAVQGFALLPMFDEDSRGSDWNDYALEHGREATASILFEGLGRAALRQQGLLSEQNSVAEAQAAEQRIEQERERALTEDQAQELGLGR